MESYRAPPSCPQVLALAVDNVGQDHFHSVSLDEIKLDPAWRRFFALPTHIQSAILYISRKDIFHWVFEKEKVALSSFSDENKISWENLFFSDEIKLAVRPWGYRSCSSWAFVRSSFKLWYADPEGRECGLLCHPVSPELAKHIERVCLNEYMCMPCKEQVEGIDTKVHYLHCVSNEALVCLFLLGKVKKAISTSAPPKALPLGVSSGLWNQLEDLNRHWLNKSSAERTRLLNGLLAGESGEAATSHSLLSRLLFAPLERDSATHREMLSFLLRLSEEWSTALVDSLSPSGDQPKAKKKKKKRRRRRTSMEEPHPAVVVLVEEEEEEEGEEPPLPPESTAAAEEEGVASLVSCGCDVCETAGLSPECDVDLSHIESAETMASLVNAGRAGLIQLIWCCVRSAKVFARCCSLFEDPDFCSSKEDLLACFGAAKWVETLVLLAAPSSAETCPVRWLCHNSDRVTRSVGKWLGEVSIARGLAAPSWLGEWILEKLRRFPSSHSVLLSFLCSLLSVSVPTMLPQLDHLFRVVLAAHLSNGFTGSTVGRRLERCLGLYSPSSTDDPLLSLFGAASTEEEVWSISQLRLLGRNVQVLANALTSLAQKRRVFQLEILRLIKDVIASLWGPTARMEIFGSFAVGLSLPSSDLDLVICDVMELYEIALLGAVRGNSPLRKLVAVLSAQPWVESVVEVAGALPLLRLVCKHHIKVDISIDSPSHRGLATVCVVRQLLDRFLGCVYRDVVAVLKQFLTVKGFADPFVGGLSSYGLIIMVHHVLQQVATEEDMEVAHGRAFVDFLQLFGRRFDPSLHCICLQNPGQLVPREAFPQHRMDPVVVLDPLSAANNLTRGCFGISQLQAELESGVAAMETAVRSGQEPLGAFFGTESFESVIVLVRQLWALPDAETTILMQQHQIEQLQSEVASLQAMVRERDAQIAALMQ